AKELSKKQAYQMFVKSNVRKALGYKLSDFKSIYDNKEQTLEKNSLVLNSLNKKDLNELKAYEKCANKLLEKSQDHRVIGMMPNTSIKDYKKYMSIECKPAN
ncbi:hypothetical protein, partial [Elizabethkingia miricola]|uniref:hypothetical protein n=1 Tax=Elizabethkingia miricola TaxID=172045 RepID=UPI0038912688